MHELAPQLHHASPSQSSEFAFSTPSLSTSMSTTSSQDTFTTFQSPLSAYPGSPQPYTSSLFSYDSAPSLGLGVTGMPHQHLQKQPSAAPAGATRVFIHPHNRPPPPSTSSDRTPESSDHLGTHTSTSSPHSSYHGSADHAVYAPPPIAPVKTVKQKARQQYPSQGHQQLHSPMVQAPVRMPSQPSEDSSKRGDDLGVSLGEFDMLNTLGTGTFGKVLLSRLRMSPSRPKQTQPHYFAVKVLDKLTVVRLRQVEHLNSERSTLAAVSGHPFVVNLVCTFQDELNLYLMLEYVQGGELFSHLRRAGRFSSDVARFYTANLVLALDYLHGRDIIYRDLKPENLLIDSTGYLKITDFGFAKYVTDRTFTLCGTPEYLAPEIITATGHGKAADFWALGVLLFELLAGYPPFFADNPLEIYEKILNGKFIFPPHIDYVAKDLIKRLLTIDLTKRLGNLKGGAEDIKNHRWFEGVDWEAVERREIRAPIIPQTSVPGDTSNFEAYPAVALDMLPGVMRAQQSRQTGIPEDSFECGADPYGYLFPSF